MISPTAALQNHARLNSSSFLANTVHTNTIHLLLTYHHNGNDGAQIEISHIFNETHAKIQNSIEVNIVLRPVPVNARSKT
jgi:hypothetical protein